MPPVVCMAGDPRTRPPAKARDGAWQKTAVANLLCWQAPGTCFAEARMGGKLFRGCFAATRVAAAGFHRSAEPPGSAALPLTIIRVVKRRKLARSRRVSGL
jgi:hypothetical protein